MFPLTFDDSRELIVKWLQRAVDDLEVDLRKRPMGRSLPTWSYSWVVEPHYHGVAVRLLYKRTSEGAYALVQAATRGDGLYGNDITHHALSAGIGGLPAALTTPPSALHGSSNNSADTSHTSGGHGVAGSAAVAGTASSAATPGSSAGPSDPEWVEVRGEVFLTAHDLKQVNADAKAAGQPLFPTGRRAAAAALKLPDPDQCRTRRLSFVAYEATSLSVVVVARDADDISAEPGSVQEQVEARPLHSSHWRTLQWLEAAGFAVSPDNMLCLSLEEAVEEAARFMSVEAPLDYDTKGVVIKFGDTGKYGIVQGTSPYDGSGGNTPPRIQPFAWTYNARQRAARRPSTAAVPGKQKRAAGPDAHDRVTTVPCSGTGSVVPVRSLTGVAGLYVCIAGKLQSTSRTEMQSLLKAHGAFVRDAVNNLTDVLLIGRKAGMRLWKAHWRPEIAILTEEEFWQKYGTSDDALAASASGGTGAGGGGGSGAAAVPAGGAGGAAAAPAAAPGAAVSAAAPSTPQTTHTLKLGSNVRGFTISVAGLLKGPVGGGMSRNAFQALLEAAGSTFHESPRAGRQRTPTQILVVGAAASYKLQVKARAWGMRIMSEKDFWQWALQ